MLVTKPKVSAAIKKEIGLAFKEIGKIGEEDEELAQPLVAQPHQILKNLSCDFEKFFYNRDYYNIKNFNTYIKVIAEHKKPELLPQVFEKMKVLGFINFNILDSGFRTK